MRHGVGFAATLAAVGIGDGQPISRVRKGRLARFAGLVFFDFRKLKRKLSFFEQGDFAIFPVDHGKRFAPVSLTAEEPVAQFIIHGSFSQSGIFEPFGNLLDALLFRQSVDVDADGGVGRVDVAAIFGPAGIACQDVQPQLLIRICGRIQDADDGQLIGLGEFEVSVVVRRYGHDGPCTVTHQDVIGHPDRNLVTVDRVDGITAGKDPCFTFGQVGTVEIAFQGGIRNIFFDSFFLFRSCDFIHQFVLGSHHHVSRAE